MEEEFIGYLEEITPKEEYLRFMKPIIIDVWNRRYREINREREELEKDIEKLRKEKTELVTLKTRGLLPDEDFVEELDRIKGRIADEQIKLEETRIENFKIEEATEYVFSFVRRMSRLWKEAEYDSKLRIQSLIFPEKVVYRYGGFETPRLSVLFQQKTELCNSVSPVVASRGNLTARFAALWNPSVPIPPPRETTVSRPLPGSILFKTT